MASSSFTADRLGQVADGAGVQGGVDLLRRWRRPRRRSPGWSTVAGSALRWRSSSRPLMSGRCMSSRIRCGTRGPDRRQAVEAGHRDLHLDLRPLRQDAAHHLDVGLVVLDVVDDPPVVVRRQPASRSSRDDRTVSGSIALGSLRMNDEPSPGTLLTRIEPPISSARRRLMTRPMPVPWSAVRSRPSRLKRLEQLLHLLRRHAHPGVGDRDLDHVGPGRAGWRCGPGRCRRCT